MVKTLLSVSALLAGMVLLYLGSGALTTLLALRMAETGFPSWQVGIVMSGYFMGLIAGAFYGHRLIAGVGHIRAFAALAALMSAATLAHPFLLAAAPWFALRFVQGICMAGLAMCTESWLNERASNETRGRILSFYQISVYLSLGAGQFLLNLHDTAGFPLFVIAAILVSLAAVPVAVTRVHAPTPPPMTRYGLGALYAISPLGMFGSFASGLVLGAFYGMGPYFAQQVGLGVTGTTTFMGVTIVGGLILQWPIGRLSDRIDRRTVLAGVCAAILLASLAVIAVAGTSGVGLLLAATLFGGVIFTLYPLCVAHANDFITPDQLVPVSAGLLVAYGIGATAGPPAASALMGTLGPGGLFAFTGGVGLVTVAYAVWRMTRRPALPLDEQGPFRPIPSTSPVAAELDPRAEPASEEGAATRRDRPALP